MATNANETTLAEILKSTYSDTRELLLKLSPFLGLAPKFEKDGGDGYKIPWAYAPPGGGSSFFSSGSNNVSPTKLKRPTLDLENNYQFARMERKMYRISKSGNHVTGKPGWQQESERALKELGNSWAKWFLNAGGTLGQNSGVGDTQTVTLVNKQEIHKIEVGMKLNFVSATSGGTIRGGGLTTTVVSVNRNAGTFSGSLYTNANGIAANDYLVRAGDYNNTAKSFADYIPSTAPAAGESFLGIDRSFDSRLYGCYVDGTTKALDVAIVDALGEVANRGGSPDFVMMNWKKLSDLKNSTATGQWSSVNVKGPVGLSYSAVEFMGPAGKVKVFADQAMPDTSIYVGQLDTWEIRSAGPLGALLDEDVGMLRVAGEDTLEWQFGGYGNLCCYEPSYNAHIVVPKSLSAAGS